MSQAQQDSGLKSDCVMTEKDRISDLPECILGQILSLLSIKDMVRTSLLAKKWMYKWQTVRNLKFDPCSFPPSSTDKEILVRAIDNVLVLHLGPVHRFELSGYCGIPFADIDKWIRYVSRQSIKELVLRVWDPNYYRIPSSLFSCQGLTYLNLRTCSLSLPSTFEGFVNLKSLTLSGVQVVQRDLENFISSSRVLERLTIDNVSNGDHLNIYAPNLLFFKIEGKFVDVRFRSVSHLTETCMNTEYRNERLHLENPEEYGGLVELMAGIPQISRLKFGYYHTVYMSAGKIPKKLPFPCVNLTSFSINVFFASSKEVSVLLCLLRSAPNLKELQITSYPEEVAEASSSGVWEWDPTCLERPFEHLQFVKIDCFMGEQEAMDFVKYMLLNSPALQSMTIEAHRYFHGSSGEDDSYAAENEMLKKMLCFKRASPEAKIIMR